jgi:hypothetical protein
MTHWEYAQMIVSPNDNPQQDGGQYRIDIGGGIENVPIKSVDSDSPDYTEWSNWMGRQGWEMVNMTVTTFGAIQDVEPEGRTLIHQRFVRWYPNWYFIMFKRAIADRT